MLDTSVSNLFARVGRLFPLNVIAYSYSSVFHIFLHPSPPLLHLNRINKTLSFICRTVEQSIRSGCIFVWLPNCNVWINQKPNGSPYKVRPRPTGFVNVHVTYLPVSFPRLIAAACRSECRKDVGWIINVCVSSYIGPITRNRRVCYMRAKNGCGDENEMFEFLHKTVGWD